MAVTSPKRAARRTTDWILDKNTKSKIRTSAMDVIAQHVKKLETDIEKRQNDVSAPQSDVIYDVNLIIELDEASANVGNGLAFAA